MGRFIETNTINWPVKVKIPKGNGSKQTDTEVFNVKFRLLTAEEREDMPNYDEKNFSAEETEEYVRKTSEIAINTIEGWDLDNLEYTPANLEKVLNNNFYRKAILKACWEAQNGGETKN